MSLYQKYIRMTVATDLREVYGPNAAKKIARDFGVAVITAKVWLAGRFPVARHDELAERITARLNRRDELSAEIRRRWASGGTGETSGVVAGRSAVPDRAKADGVGRKVTDR